MAKIIKDEQNNNTITTKARYWTAVCYPESMRPDWRDVIGEVLQIPGVYTIHDKDVDGDQDDRKVHVHVMCAWANTTTYKAALQLFQLLSAPGKRCCNTCQKVQNVRYMYNYLIHDTDDARKKHKFQYKPADRVAFNNFDIGAYEQLGVADKRAIRRAIGKIIIDENFTNYIDLYNYILSNYDGEYEETLVCYSGHFVRMVDGNWQKLQYRK